MTESESKKARTEDELKVSNRTPTVEQLMFGASGFGCLFKEVEEDQCKECVDKALELGIKYIDTAPWYGAGLSETRLGNILGGKWDGLLLSTKCGRVIKPKDQITEADNEEKGYHGDEGGQFFTSKFHNNRPCWDYSAAGIRESVRQSLERMKVDHLQDLRLHDAESEERYTQATEGGGVDAMIALRKEGKTKQISLGMNDHKFILRLLRKYPNTFDNVMLAGCFNLIDNDSTELLLECQKQGIHVTNVGIFASGVLWGGDHYKYGNIPDSVKEKVTKWKALAEKYGLSLPQLAFNFAFLPEVVDYVAFGTSRVKAVAENVALAGKSVPLKLWQEAQEQGLIDERVPLPK
jgi:D-threo-aldose 1-dehydrogenase